MKRSIIISMAVIASLFGANVNAQSLVSALETPQTSQRNETNQTEKDQISEFDCVQLSYLAGFSDFSKGFYGIGWEKFSKNLVSSLSFHGSWGLTEPGLYGMRLGFGYALAPTSWFAFMIKAVPFWQTYVSNAKYNKGKMEYDTSFGGGILASPGIKLKVGSVSIGANFDIGYAYLGGSGLYKDIMLTLGLKI